MALHAISAHAIANQSTILQYHVTESADFLGFAFSNLKVNPANVPCALHGRLPSCIIQSLYVHRRNSKSRASVFCIPNEKDQAVRSSSYNYADDQMQLALEKSKSSDNSDVEIVSSTSYSDINLAHTVALLDRQGSLLEKLQAIQLHVLASEQWNASKLVLCHRNYLVSATNLIHYLAFRCLDCEQLKDDLSLISLLNLENINSHVLASLTACIQVLKNLKSNSLQPEERISSGILSHEILHQQKYAAFSIEEMKKKASSNRELLLGQPQDSKIPHIMVTVGKEAIENEALINDLIKSGTSVFRINCAHGNPSIWSEIIRRVRESSQMLEKPCRILMDLAGPKLRTGKLKPGPAVIKISPKRTAAGSVIRAVQVWLSHKEAGPPPPHLSLDQVLFIDNKEFLTKLEEGDTLRFCDVRGKKRTLRISGKFHVFSGAGYVAECCSTAYIQSGTRLYMKGKKGRFHVGQVVDVPTKETSIRLRVGDLLTISRGSSSKQDELSVCKGGAHRVTCCSGYLFDSVKPGDPIAFDDGKIWGVIQGTSISEIIVSITHASPKGTKLGSEKSINIPESNIRFEGLTSKDLMDLEFVAANADMVGLSFVRDTRDIIVLQCELEKRKLQNLGIVLKIETKSGFEKLPLVLLEAMKSGNPLGVMIARGDLAVECGWERLADMQEEILSICDAAHLPVIWATQVLESLVKSGNMPTRAEITDAANGRRASCVMLNKGKYIVRGVSGLEKILHSNSKMKPDLESILLCCHLS
ncbi:plastidial pyruvate kinase 4, chloroplastic [Euphorbia lathyris]|uniref:plastidial pyruvate kinase 4, chloroplastic n=1 Tax=Euphorbia lathyris TaxID=212925 RepID=UPI0033137D5F